MHVRWVELTNVMGHSRTRVELPEAGLVLVGGPNGGGKSALIEAVSMALFGETLRGTPPWAGDGEIAVGADVLEVRCTKKGSGTPKVLWNLPGEQPVKYDTPTKARAAMGPIVGSFDLWRRTSVFSAADAAHFSLASDKERKLLLESLLGLDRFDTALKACRADLKDAESAVARLSNTVASQTEKAAGLRSRIADMEEVPPAPALPEVPPDAHVRAARDELRELEAALQQNTQQARTSAKAVAEKDAALGQAKRAAASLDKDSCPTCGQSIPVDTRKALRDGVAAAKLEAEQAHAAQHAAEVFLRAEESELQLEVRRLRTYLDKAEAAKRTHAAAVAAEASAAASREEKRGRLQRELFDAEDKLKEASDQLDLQRADVDELRVIEMVLGLRGVRAHMLTQALDAINGLAGAWLAKLFPGVTAELREENDKIVQVADGLPHAYGYKGASSGQRRRIDIANLLGMGELEATSKGVTPGTLWLDEIADTLDSTGIDLFADVLQELAHTRAVVLIAHTPELQRRLAPYAVKRLHVEDGVVHER